MLDKNNNLIKESVGYIIIFTLIIITFDFFIFYQFFDTSRKTVHGVRAA
jgi:hypothetical protein